MNNSYTGLSNTTYTTSTLIPSVLSSWHLNVTTGQTNIATSASSNTFTMVSSVPTTSFKLCRNCSHAHIAGQKVCIMQEGWNIISVICVCEEYVPKDNLEYLEYMYDKKQKLN